MTGGSVSRDYRLKPAFREEVAVTGRLERRD
jgi:hypothetical protein